MSNTPKTDALFFPYGRDHTAAASPSFLTCWTEYELLEMENAALREQLKDCSAVVDRQQEALDRNAEQIAILRNALSRLVEVHDAMGGKCGTVRIAAEEALLGKAQSEYICTCGIRVTPHKCPADNDF